MIRMLPNDSCPHGHPRPALPRVTCIVRGSTALGKGAHHTLPEYPLNNREKYKHLIRQERQP